MKKLLALFALTLALAAPATAQVEFKVGMRFGATMNWFRAVNVHSDITNAKFGFGGQAINGSFFGADNTDERSQSLWRGTLGVLFRVGFGKFAVQPELLFSGQGGRATRTISPLTFATYNSNADALARLNYLRQENGQTTSPTAQVGLNEELSVRYENVNLQVPILARYRPLGKGVISPYVLFGPVIDFRLFSLQWNERAVADVGANKVRFENKGTNFNEMDNVRLANIGTSLAMGAGVDFPFGMEIEFRYNLGLSPFATFKNNAGTEMFALKQRSWFLTLSKTFGK
jgi:hypothetical protein